MGEIRSVLKTLNAHSTNYDGKTNSDETRRG